MEILISLVTVLQDFVRGMNMFFSWNINIAGYDINMFIMLSVPFLLAVVAMKIIQLFIK